jgi:hypothetical protein
MMTIPADCASYEFEVGLSRVRRSIYQLINDLFINGFIDANVRASTVPNFLHNPLSALRYYGFAHKAAGFIGFLKLRHSYQFRKTQTGRQ